MFLIVGLGNPGEELAKSRHNVGFWFVDAIKPKINQEPVELLKPQTFMNRSGEDVAREKNYKKIDNDQIIVVCDDVNLPVGRARIRRGGEHGGHNGLKSVIAAIGEDFWRVRIGVGDAGMALLEDYVLSSPIPDEEKEITEVIDKMTSEVLESIAREKLENKTI